MLIKVKALGHRKKLLNRLSRQAPLDSLIDFYRGLKLIPNYCEFNKGIFFEEVAVCWMINTWFW